MFSITKFDNGLFVPKYEKSSVITEDICTKPYSGPIISWINKCMTGFRIYSTSDTKHYQLMRLHYFVVNLTDYQEKFRRKPG